MTNEELKKALLSSQPVLYMQTDGTESEYKCVSAIVYRKQGKQIALSVELLDKTGTSVILCDPKKVRLKEGAKNAK